jgi:hypothetical protein
MSKRFISGLLKSVAKGRVLMHNHVMGENGGSVRFDVLVKPEAGSSLGQDGSERSLAHLKWVAAQIVTVQLDQVEGIEEHARVVVPVSDTVERCDPVLAACDRFAVDDAGPWAQPGERLDDQREALGQSLPGRL